MTSEEIRAYIRDGEMPVLTRYEKVQNSAEYVGQMFGEKTEYLSPVAEAMRRCCGIDEVLGESDESCSGAGCDSNCGCS